jgi:hypothetical protein
MEEIKIDAARIEKIKQAAKDCPTTKKALETIFPEAFADDRCVNKYGLTMKYNEGMCYPEFNVGGKSVIAWDFDLKGALEKVFDLDFDKIRIKR